MCVVCDGQIIDQGKSVREQMPAHNPNKQTIGRAFIEDQDVDRVMAENDG
jgi:hypothetical protein